jgi:hypothetical protein
LFVVIVLFVLFVFFVLLCFYNLFVVVPMHITIFPLFLLFLTVINASSTQLTNWQLQTSAKVQSNGKTISTPSYDARGWYPVVCPATVLAGLVQNNVYVDPFYGLNLQIIH